MSYIWFVVPIYIWKINVFNYLLYANNSIIPIKKYDSNIIQDNKISCTCRTVLKVLKNSHPRNPVALYHRFMLVRIVFMAPLYHRGALGNADHQNPSATIVRVISIPEARWIDINIWIIPDDWNHWKSVLTGTFHHPLPRPPPMPNDTWIYSSDRQNMHSFNLND